MKLSILIPTIPSRKLLFTELYAELCWQIYELKALNDVRILVHDSYIMSIGEKRNELVERASGEFIAFIDDDDAVAENYVSTLLKGIETNPDCISLRGIMTTNGENPEIFEHSIKYSQWRTTENEIKYERYPNHLNCIRASIAKQFIFPEKNHGEDHAWSKAIHQSGLLKNEFYTDKILYYYRYNSTK